MKIKTLIKGLLFLFAIIGIERLCHLATDGFALVNIYAPPHRLFKTDQEALEIEGPFHYLSSGSQSYVFISEDGKTILKFFKFQHMRIPPWINYLPLPTPFSKLREEKKKKKQDILERTLQSYALAYDKLKEETGLLYVHLSPTCSLQKQVTIYDKIGKKHTIELDQVEFALQKRASLVYETLDGWMAQGNVEKAQKGLSSLFDLVEKRCKKGLFDKDPDFSTNFGFVDEIPIQIDVGRLWIDETEKKPEIYQPEMIRITRSLQDWVEKNHPDLLPSFNRFRLNNT